MTKMIDINGYCFNIFLTRVSFLAYFIVIYTLVIYISFQMLYDIAFRRIPASTQAFLVLFKTEHNHSFLCFPYNLSTSEIVKNILIYYMPHAIRYRLPMKQMSSTNSLFN